MSKRIVFLCLALCLILSLTACGNTTAAPTPTPPSTSTSPKPTPAPAPAPSATPTISTTSKPTPTSTNYQDYFSKDGKSWDIEGFLKANGYTYDTYESKKFNGTLFINPKQSPGTESLIIFSPNYVAIESFIPNDKTDAVPAGYQHDKSYRSIFNVRFDRYFFAKDINGSFEDFCIKYCLESDAIANAATTHVSKSISILGYFYAEEQIKALIQCLENAPKMQMDYDNIEYGPYPFTGHTSIQSIGYSYEPNGAFIGSSFPFDQNGNIIEQGLFESQQEFLKVFNAFKASKK